MSPPKLELTIQKSPQTRGKSPPGETTRDARALESSDTECPRALKSSVEAVTQTRGGEGASVKQNPPRGVWPCMMLRLDTGERGEQRGGC